MGKKIIVTGAAGFIGYHLCRRLLQDNHTVIGVDNLNSYYDAGLKHDRLKLLFDSNGFNFFRADLEDKGALLSLFSKEKPETVVNLAAQAGVRYSLVNPDAYVSSNVVGFLNVLEGCKESGVSHLVFASSSSVYGANTRMPFSVHHSADHPVSLYAATKKANELMAHTYSHLYGLPCTGLRFFTVYGPWGRPDMALFLFTKSILEGTPIDVFNYGRMKRDFTYIDDIVEGVVRVMGVTPRPDPDWDRDGSDCASSYAPYRLYNIGNNQPVELSEFIAELERCIGRKARKNMKPLQDGDVPVTYADIDDLMECVGFRPSTPLSRGIEQFVAWYMDYYQNSRREHLAIPVSG